MGTCLRTSQCIIWRSVRRSRSFILTLDSILNVQSFKRVRRFCGHRRRMVAVFARGAVQFNIIKKYNNNEFR